MPPTRLNPNSLYSPNTYIHIHKSSQRSCRWRMPLGRIEKPRVLWPSQGTSVTGLAAIMRKGVFIVFCFVCSTVIGWNWHTHLSVSHTHLRSFRNNVQRVYTQQRWWISQPARFRPRNRVWTWKLEREMHRKIAIYQTHGEVIPRDYFPLSLIWTITVYFSVWEMSARTGLGCMAQ